MEDRFESLGLSDTAQRDYVHALVQEDLAFDEKVEAVIGLLETQNEDDVRPAVESLIKDLDQSRAKQQAASVQSAAPVSPRQILRPPSPEPVSPSKPARILTEEERLQRERLLKQYGDVEEEVDVRHAPPALASPGVTTKSKTKASARSAGGADDLLAFKNTNTSDVKAAETAKREAAASAHAAKKDKDKQDLTKQRADQEKRKEEARKKAARSERRG